MSKKSKKPLSKIDGGMFYVPLEKDQTPVFEAFAQNIEGDDQRTEFEIIELLTPAETALFNRLLNQVISRLEKLQWEVKTLDGQDPLDDLRGPTAVWGGRKATPSIEFNVDTQDKNREN